MCKRNRILSVFVAATLLVSVVSGCSKKTSPEDTYIAMAQEFLAQEDHAAAIDILQKGAEITQSKKIDALIEEIKAERGKNADWDAIWGTWSEENIGWDDGGMVLDIGKIEGEDGGEWVEICLTLVQGAPASRVAEIYSGVEPDEMTWPTYTSEFEDSWGNSGVFTLTFGEDSIECVIGEDMDYDSSANWGVYPGVYTLVRNDDAWGDLSYDMDEYYELYPEERPAPAYDTSKASGILASLGMTEEQFRASCKPLSIDGKDEDITTAKELREYPAKYTGQCFYISGDHLGEPGGYYKPDSIVVNSKRISADGYPMYIDYPNWDWYEHVLVFDARDDVYAPTISEGEGICPYLIFSGVQTIGGTDYVCFQLISVDKK